MNLISWSKSECKSDGWLHRYEIVEQNQDGVLEVCTLCGDHQFFKVVNGRTDNMTYLKFHLRNALPKNHFLFNREYNLNK